MFQTYVMPQFHSQSWLNIVAIVRYYMLFFTFAKIYLVSCFSMLGSYFDS